MRLALKEPLLRAKSGSGKNHIAEQMFVQEYAWTYVMLLAQRERLSGELSQGLANNKMRHLTRPRSGGKDLNCEIVIVSAKTY
jgi:hypothetical protein